MSKWISVEDRLPESGVNVIACQVTHNYGFQLQFVGHYTGKFEEVSDCDCDDFNEYDESTDEYYVPEGWYENQYNWDEFASIAVHGGDVTHWMPLPEPPK